MKFKVGQKVKVIRDLPDTMDEYYCGSIKKGSCGTIQNFPDNKNGFYPVDYGSVWFWAPEKYLQKIGGSMTIDNLEVGDVLLKNDGRKAKILGKTGLVVLLSLDDSFDEATNYWYTERDLKDSGWRFKGEDDEDDTVEMTVAEIENKLDLEEGTLRIKKDEE